MQIPRRKYCNNICFLASEQEYKKCVNCIIFTLQKKLIHAHAEAHTHPPTQSRKHEHTFLGKHEQRQNISSFDCYSKCRLIFQFLARTGSYDMELITSRKKDVMFSSEHYFYLDRSLRKFVMFHLISFLSCRNSEI